VLDRDPLDDVGDVLGLVDRRLEETVDLLPLHEVDRVLLLDEERGDRGPDDPVALVLEAMDLDPVAIEALEALEMGQGVMEQLDLLHDDRGLLDGGRGRRLDAVEDERVGRLLDEVDDVVEGTDQGIDVLAVERCDERRLEPMPDLVADLVAAVLRRPDLRGTGLGLVVRPEHGLEQPGAAEDVRGILDEEIEESNVARDQAKAQGGSSEVVVGAASCAGRIMSCPGRLPGLGLRGGDRFRVPDGRGPVRCSLPMDWIVVGFLGVLAIALAIAIGVALDRDRTLEATRTAVVRSSLGLSPLAQGGSVELDGSSDRGDAGRRTAEDAVDPDADVPTLVRRLRDRLDASEFELDQQVRNASYLADLMGVGIVRLDERGTVELANAAAHILLRRPAGSLRGRSAVETFLDNRVDELIATARAGGGASGEFRLSGPDGPTLVVRARRSPISGVWVVLEDVSELRRLQQIRTQFVDNLSHELRTPLSTVSLLAETLARDAEAAGDGVPPRMRDRIGKIEVETGHLVQMVNELLDLARIEGGGPLVLLDDVDLGRVASDAAERLRLFAERQGLRLVVDVPSRVPPVRGDEARLGQVVVNLVHNALKFGRSEDRVEAPEGQPTDQAGEVSAGAPAGADPPPPEPVANEVRVSVRAAGGEVVLAVEDHGVGIPAADRARIFERFYKVDRVRVRGGGTGLGLAIARHVIEQHGGRIQVESVEGAGSTFTVSLPVARPVGSVAARGG